MRIWILLVFIITSLGSNAQSKASNPFESMLRSYFEEYLKLNPTTASSLGDYRYNDQLENTISQPYRDQVKRLYTRYLDSLENYNLQKLSPGSTQLPDIPI